MSTIEQKAREIDEALAKLDALTVDASVQTVNEEGRPRPQASILIDLGRNHYLFHDHGGDAFARVTVGARKAVYPIIGTDYREHLAREFYMLSGKGCNRNTLVDATATLSAIGKFDGPAETVNLRVGKCDNGIIIDLGDDTGEAVIVTATGWQIDDAPVNFKRTGKPLPLPRPSGACDTSKQSLHDFDKLWRYVNVETADRVLIAGWLLSALRPDGPYPILNPVGEQGSGKSSTTRTLKALTDPSAVPLRPPPREDRDLLTAASSSWLVALDNLSHVNAQLSDCLCRLATGGGFAGRRLYTDSEEHLVQVTRPLILNGIEDIATRPDLSSRCIHLMLPVLTTRATESDMDAGFKKDASEIFAALLDGLSLALRDHNTVKIGALPRMADFARWAAAGVPALGFTADQFITAYRSNIRGAADLALESSPVASAVITLMDDKAEWTGRTEELLYLLLNQAGENAANQSWPKSARGLIGALRRLAPSLRGASINYSHTHTRDGGRLTLCKARLQASHPSQVSPKGAERDTCDASIPTLHNAPAILEIEL